MDKEKALKSLDEMVELYKKLENERNRFLTIAYNAICLGQLNEIYNENKLLKELGCTKEEYNKIMKE